MTSARAGNAHRYIRSIRRNLNRLEELFRGMESQTSELRPHDTRSELLEQIHVAGAMDESGLNSNVIGMSEKDNYPGN